MMIATACTQLITHISFV